MEVDTFGNPYKKPPSPGDSERGKVGRGTASPQSDGRIRTGFIVAIALGSLSVFATWMLQAGALFSIGLPIVVMLAFIGLTAQAASKGSRSDQIADSWYYLGFILTLIALAISMYDFGVSDRGHVQQSGLLTRIGIALATSVVGLFARLCVTQFSAPEEKSQDAVMTQAEAIVEAIRKTHEELAKASDDFRKILEDQTNAFRNAFEGGGKKFNVAELLREPMAAFKTSLNESVTEMKAANKRINDSIIMSGANHAKRLEELSEANKNVFKKAVDEFELGIAGVFEKLNKRAETADLVPEDVRVELGQASLGLKKEIEALNAAIKAAIVDVEALPTGAAEALNGMREDFADIEELRRELQDGMTKAARLIGTTIAQMSEAMNQLSDVIEAVAKGNEQARREHAPN